MLVFLSGKITDNGDEYDDISLGGLPLIKSLERFDGKQVSVCWAFDDQPISPEAFSTIALETQEGQIDAGVTRGWSEATGNFGWANCQVGGHNLQVVFASKKNAYGALMTSTEPIDLTVALEADQTVSWFLETR